MPDFLIVSQALLWLAAILLSVTCLALVRQVGILYERIAPAGALSVNKVLKAGEEAPQMEVTTIDGLPLTVGGTREDGRSALLFFLSPNCPVCKTLLPVLGSLQRAEKSWLDVIMASDGGAEKQKTFIREQGLEKFPYVLSEPLGRAFGVAQLPYGVLIGADGVIAAMGLVNNREHIESLFEAKDRGVTSIQEYMRAQERRDDNQTSTEKLDGAADGPQ